MTSRKRNHGVLLAAGILLLTAFAAGAAKGGSPPATAPNTLARPAPTTSPSPSKKDPRDVVFPAATSGAQAESIVESGTAVIFLSGTGDDWTLVTAPQHGALTIISGKDGYWGHLITWTPGMTAPHIIRSADPLMNIGLGCVYYKPAAGYVGPDSFKWHSSNASGTSPDALCSITVTPNSAPVATNQSVTCVPDGATTLIALDYSHADRGSLNNEHVGQTLTFTLVSTPAHGTLKYWNGGKSGSAGAYATLQVGKPVPYYGWYYTPEAAYKGPDSFTWKANDTFVDSATATVSIMVGANTASVPAAKPASKEEGYIGPGDIVPGAMAWYGCRGYNRAVSASGRQKALRLFRHSDGAGIDVLIKPNGDLDTAAAVAFGGGATCRVTIWYDQSGHGNDLLGYRCAKPETCPLLCTVSCKRRVKAGDPYPECTADSLPCIECQGDDRGFENVRFRGGSPIGTFSAVSMRYSVAGFGQLIAMNWSSYMGMDASNQAYILDGTGRDTTKTIIKTSVDETVLALHAFQGVINGSSSVLNIDGTPTPGNLDPANLANAFSLGVSGAYIGKVTEGGVWPTVFSSEEQTAMYQNQRDYWHIPARVTVPRGVVKAVYVKEALPINGTLNEWAKGWMPCSPPLLLGKVASTEIGALQTYAHILMDEENLYVAWVCQEHNSDDLVAKTTERDGAVAGDDNVELFLSPDGKAYYHFIVNSEGVFSDGKGDLNGKEDLAWNSAATVKTSVNAGKGWSGTMRIPLKDLAPASGKNQTWLLNINRNKPVEDKSGVTTFIESSWSSAKSSGHSDAAGWGKLTGVNIP